MNNTNTSNSNNKQIEIPSEMETLIIKTMQNQFHILEKRLYKGLGNQIIKVLDKIDTLKD